MKRFQKVLLGMLAAGIFSFGVLKAFSADLPQTNFNLNDTWQLSWGTKLAEIYGSSIGNYIRFQSNGSDAVTINNSNLGIGTTAPAFPLTVATSAGGQQAMFTPNLSSFTVSNATGSFALTSLAVCMAQSTMSLTFPAGISNVWLSYAGASSASVLSSTISIGVLVDGGYASFAGVKETSSRGIVAVGNGNATAGTGGNDLNMSFGPVTVTGLAAGTHNFCLLEDSTSGTVTIDTTNAISAFTAWWLP